MLIRVFIISSLPHTALGRMPLVSWVTDKSRSSGMVNENSIHAPYQSTDT